jgi:predicted secreted Zn-dependent protease
MPCPARWRATPQRRIYYTGDNSPKKTNLLLATSGADYPFEAVAEMGLPAPAVPSVSVTTAGSAPNSARTYVVTFYDSCGEEGPPSPVSASVTFGATGFTVALSAIDTGKKSCTIVRSGSTATATCAGPSAARQVEGRHVRRHAAGIQRHVRDHGDRPQHVHLRR